MATEYTPNYNLDLYASADKPNLRDQYNAAMGKVDAQMKKTADDVTNANANVLTMQSQVSKNKEDIAALESTVETHGAQITGAQKTADDALSLAQTSETDIAGTQADVQGERGRGRCEQEQGRHLHTERQRFAEGADRPCVVHRAVRPGNGDRVRPCEGHRQRQRFCRHWHCCIAADGEPGSWAGFLAHGTVGHCSRQHRERSFERVQRQSMG